jgi:hypothetical protein
MPGQNSTMIPAARPNSPPAALSPRPGIGPDVAATARSATP